MNLTHKVALITGGTRMGLAVSKALSQQGCEVILTWRSSRAEAEAVVAELRRSGGRAQAFPLDVSKPASLQKLTTTLQKRYGHLDALIHMASIYEAGSMAERWDEHLDANLKGAFQLTGALMPLLKKAKESRIVMISDWTSASGRPRYAEYGAYYVSKAGIKALVESLALELAPKILVNAIAPGPMIPPKGLTPSEDRAVREATPLKRWGGAEEIAKAVLFLMETDFVTGETIRVDGGRHLY